MGLWNRDRDCEPARLSVAARMEEIGRKPLRVTEHRNPVSGGPGRGFAIGAPPGTKWCSSTFCVVASISLAVRIKALLKWFSLGPAEAGPLFARPGNTRELGKARSVSLSMIDRDLEGTGGARHYSRWPDLWRSEDDWGPIIAAVMFLIIFGGLIVSASGVHL